MARTLDKIRTGKKLRALRGNRTQKVVADAIGVSTMAISLYESGKRSPSDSTKIALAEYFGETVQDIFFTF